jgi:uncharacterized protein (DUF2141 family)
MRRTIILSALLLSSGSQAGELELALHGVGLAGKKLYIAVHDSAQDFPMDDSKALTREVTATGELTALSIGGLPAGEYAVAVFADLNGNGALDSNFIGIPKEPVGMSRDAQGRFGPPKFADAVFRMGDGVTRQTIHLK